MHPAARFPSFLNAACCAALLYYLRIPAAVAKAGYSLMYSHYVEPGSHILICRRYMAFAPVRNYSTCTAL